MADSAIDISWEVDGQDKLVKSLNEAAKASERAAAALKRQGDAVKYVDGPNQRLARLNNQLAHASAAGNGLASADIQRRIEQTQKQLAPKTVASFEKRLETAIRSTRFNTKGGVSPLIGQVADLAGLGAGPALAAEKAVEGFTDALKLATEAGNKFGALQIGLGSGGDTTGALQNLGRSAADAKAFNDRIASDPTAIGLAATLGIGNRGGIYGDQDYGKLYLDAIKRVRAIQDPTERLRYARGLGIDDTLTNLSDNAFNRRVGSDAERSSQIFNSDYTQKSAEFANSTERLGQAFTNLTAIVMGPTINGYTTLANELADIVNGRMSLKRFITGEGEDKYGNAVDPHLKATQENTKATQDLTNQIGIGQRQYGSGERSDRAVPRAYGIGSGYNLERNMHALSRTLGAFG